MLLSINSEHDQRSIEELKRKTIKTKSGITVVKGLENFYTSLVDVIGKAEKEYLGTAGPLGGKTHSFIHKVINEKRKKGLKQKLLVEITKDNADRVKILLKQGIKIKHFPVGNLRMQIIDRKLVFISCKPPEGEITGIVIEDPTLADFLVQFFLYLWRQGIGVKKRFREFGLKINL